ncbi:MAG: neutral zinc metallopeptidase [bacterium]|nr:neutral zinc metallopeptidase [bacterium]
MRWIGRRQSENVEDRRGMSPKTMVGGGLGTLIIVIIVLLLGGNPLELLQNMPEAETGMVGQSTSQEDNELAQFAKVVMADTEDIWGRLFQQAGGRYQPPVLVLYTDMVQSACGYGSAATGPFYCPGDSKVYIDLSFYRDLQTRFQAPGDFAMAYVIAHEVGHHIQNLTGVNDKVMAVRERADQRTYNKYSVAMELQADFYSGIWAHYDQKLNNVLEEGDLEEALNAASAVGDDRIQKRTRGTVVPDAFTHGTSEQRRMWFEKGFRTGDLSQGDTFAAYGLEL